MIAAVHRKSSTLKEQTEGSTIVGLTLRGRDMPNDGQTIVEQLRALIRGVLDMLSRSHEIITRLDATRPPKPPEQTERRDQHSR